MGNSLQGGIGLRNAILIVTQKRLRGVAALRVWAKTLTKPPFSIQWARYESKPGISPGNTF